MKQRSLPRAALAATCTLAVLGGALLLPGAAAAQGGPSALGWTLVPLSDAYVNQLLNGYDLTGDPCEVSASLLARGGMRGVQEDFATAVAGCINLTDPKEAAECLDEAVDEFVEAVEEIFEQHEARLELCELLGGGPYDPEVDPEDFSPDLTNPLLSFAVGSTWTYHAMTDEGLEVIEVVVLDETKEVGGVECRVVRDTVTLEGELVEDTHDYYAQDSDGNVWYFGEIALNYEDGDISDVEGSWMHDTDGAKAGIVMFASPVLDTTYRQEFLLGEAEDAGTVLALDAEATVPFGATWTGCLLTADFTPLEPDALEHKTYAPGVGLVLEEDPESGERVELVDHTTL